MSSSFLVVEIDEVVSNRDGNMILGQISSTSLFQEVLDSFKGGERVMCNQLYVIALLSMKFSSNFIILILNVNSILLIGDLWAISYHGSLYKLMDKLLVG